MNNICMKGEKGELSIFYILKIRYIGSYLANLNYYILSIQFLKLTLIEDVSLNEAKTIDHYNERFEKPFWPAEKKVKNLCLIGQLVTELSN